MKQTLKTLFLLISLCLISVRGFSTSPPKPMELREQERLPNVEGLYNVKWRIVAINSNPVNAGFDLSLFIDQDYGRYIFETGCNNIMGKLNIKEGTNTMFFNMGASTRKACPQERTEYETLIATLVSNISNYQINGDNLLLLDSNKSVLMKLVK